MKLAIQEDMLPGRSWRERFERAQQIGFDGVELWMDGTEEHLLEIASALETTGLAVAALNIGRNDGYLAPEMPSRESAIALLRRGIATAADFEAGNLVFVPHFGELSTPDLKPHRSAEEIASDLMLWLLRTVSDLGYVFDVTLHMQPRHRYITSFMNTVAQAVRFSDAIKNNPHVRIAPNLFDMALEESDVRAVLKQHHDRIGYLHLSDSNGRLPGQGLLNWQAIADTLHEVNYDGWLCLSMGHPIHSREVRYGIYDALPGCLQLLRDVGLC